MRQMYIDLEIKNSSSRAYLEFYIDGKRHREYNANKLNLHIFPNNAKSDLIKNKLLNKLKFEFQKAIENGWKPYLEEKKIPIKLQISLEEQVNDTLNSKLNENYSKSYKEDLKSLSKKFLDYLSPIEKKSAIETLEISRIVSFLDQFNSSNRNYMNKRQTLNVLLPNTLKYKAKKMY